MVDEIGSETMTDEEFQDAVQELTEEQPAAPAVDAEQPAKPVKGAGKLRTELAKLETQRAELKHTKKEDLDGGAFAQVKAHIAEIKAILGE